MNLGMQASGNRTQVRNVQCAGIALLALLVMLVTPTAAMTCG